MKKKLLALAIVSVMMITALCACGNSGSSIPGKGKVFRYTVNNVPTTLDPNLCNGITDNEFQHVLTEGLTRTTGGTVTPGIAESWDISDDGLVYTFHLRDAVWSDGVPVTADDFVYSWRRLVDPATKSDYAFASWMIKGGKKVNLEGADPSTLGVRAIDDKTLEVTLENPVAYFLSFLGNESHFAPVRQDYVEKYGSEFAKDPDKNVYSGPFILTSAEENRWEFKKNPLFWDADNIQIEQATAIYPSDEDEQIDLFKEGELDFAFIPNDMVAKYRNQKNVNHYLNGLIDYLYINTKCDNKILSNRNFRLALNYALNRKLYNHKANDDAYKPYTGLVFPGLNGKDGVTYGEVYYVDSYTFPIEGDIDLARELLAKAMKEMDISSADDISIVLTFPDSEENRRIAEELKSQWKSSLGINIIPDPQLRADVYSKIYPSGDYELGFTGWASDYNDPYSYLEIWRSDNTSYTPYGNPEIDEILDATITELDPEKRMDMLNQVERMLIEDAPLVPLEAKDKYYMLNPKVQNLTLSFCNITLDWAYAGIAD